MTHVSLGQRLLEPIRSGCSHIDWASEDAEAIVDIEVSDRLTMLMGSIYVLGNKPVTEPLIMKQPQAVIDRLAYLGGSLRLIEWDQISQMIQMRGRPERADGKPPEYFEIIIDRTPSILLHRRCAQETIPFLVSIDRFVRLVDDLVRIVKL
jgi:hypothetical protein